MKVMLLTLLLTVAGLTTARAETAAEREYELKAAFLYNYIAFVDGPRLQPPDKEGSQGDEKAVEPIVIGVIGEDPFGAALEPLEDKEVRDRPVAIRRFKGLQWNVQDDGSKIEVFPDFDQVRQCHVLFICASERAHAQIILDRLEGNSILTVADVPGFLDIGGTINFVIEEKKVRFDINLAAATRAKLEIRSKLLRLAKKVQETDLVEEPDDDENQAPSKD